MPQQLRPHAFLPHSVSSRDRICRTACAQGQHTPPCAEQQACELAALLLPSSHGKPCCQRHLSLRLRAGAGGGAGRLGAPGQPQGQAVGQPGGPAGGDPPHRRRGAAHRARLRPQVRRRPAACMSLSALGGLGLT